MNIPPDPNGKGGSQRAWYMLDALARIAPVHAVLLHPAHDGSIPGVSLDAARGIAASFTVVPVRAWDTTRDFLPWLPWRVSAWVDMLRLGSMDAPRLPPSALRQIAAALPEGPVDVFAVRPASAVIADQLIARGLLTARRKAVDLDDILSRFRRRQAAAQADRLGPIGVRVQLADAAILERAEDRLVRGWDVASVCSEEDAGVLRARLPNERVVTVANVVDRPRLPPPPPHGGLDLLFVGNLAFEPNREGLTRFLDEAWPEIARRRPDVRLTVVGMGPPPELLAKLDALGIPMHANVPSVLPYYEACDAVISPITFGTGTRIKIIEAMALGRAVIATALGAEGLDLADGRDALLSDTVAGMADAICRLAVDPGRVAGLADAARAIQQARFGAETMWRGVAAMLADAPAREGAA